MVSLHEAPDGFKITPEMIQWDSRHMKDRQAGASSLKRANDARYDVQKVLKRSANRLTLNGLRFSKAYDDGRLNLAHKIGPRGEGNNRNLVSVVEGARLKDSHCIGYPRLNAQSAGCGADCDEFDVLFDSVEVVEGKEERPLPSHVRFESAYRFLILGGEIAYLSLYGGGKEMLSRFGEWEVNSLGVFPIPESEIAGKIIERGTQIMDSVADDQGKVIRRVFQAADLNDKVAGLRISFMDNFIGIGGVESPDLDVKIQEVLIGPFNL